MKGRRLQILVELRLQMRERTEAANAVQELDARGRDGGKGGQRAAGKESRSGREDKRPCSFPFSLTVPVNDYPFP